MADFDWNAYGMIIGSTYRSKVTLALAAGPKSPKEISNSTSVHKNHVSSTLKDLENLRVVVCLTPRLRKGKLFQLTDLGREIVGKIREY